jgi:hypothetical protein
VHHDRSAGSTIDRAMADRVELTRGGCATGSGVCESVSFAQGEREGG